MWCDRSSKISRRSSWGSAHHADDFEIGINAARVASGRPRSGGEVVVLDASDVPLVAGCTPQDPRRPGEGAGGGRALHDTHTLDALKRGPRHRVEPLDAPRSLGTTDEGAYDGSHAATLRVQRPSKGTTSSPAGDTASVSSAERLSGAPRVSRGARTILSRRPVRFEFPFKGVVWHMIPTS